MTMMPEEIMAAFATAATVFPQIVGQPSDNDLTALCDVLYPLLLEIPTTRTLHQELITSSD